MIIWVIGCWLRESESVAGDGEVTYSLWIFLGGFGSFKRSSVFVVMLTIQLKKRDSYKKIEFQRKKFHNNIQPT